MTRGPASTIALWSMPSIRMHPSRQNMDARLPKPRSPGVAGAQRWPCDRHRARCTATFACFRHCKGSRSWHTSSIGVASAQVKRIAHGCGARSGHTQVLQPAAVQPHALRVLLHIVQARVLHHPSIRSAADACSNMRACSNA